MSAQEVRQNALDKIGKAIAIADTGASFGNGDMHQIYVLLSVAVKEIESIDLDRLNVPFAAGECNSGDTAPPETCDQDDDIQHLLTIVPEALAEAYKVATTTCGSTIEAIKEQRWNNKNLGMSLKQAKWDIDTAINILRSKPWLYTKVVANRHA